MLNEIMVPLAADGVTCSAYDAVGSVECVMGTVEQVGSLVYPIIGDKHKNIAPAVIKEYTNAVV